MSSGKGATRGEHLAPSPGWWLSVIFQLPRHLGWRGPTAGLMAALLSGCFSPMTLDRAVLGYDEAFADILSKQLLLNIARARHSRPVHFTGVSNIAATYNFQFTAGGTPAFTGNSGALIAPIFGGSVAENPTISVVPLQGEEFTKRLLTPFQQGKLLLFLQRNCPVDLLFRLTAEEFRWVADGKVLSHRNVPSDSVGYPTFRRIVTHLASIQDSSDLYMEPLMLRRSWILPADTMTLEAMRSLAKDDVYIQFDGRERLYRLSTRVPGAVVITNYDPEQLSDDEKLALHTKAQEGQANDIMVDVREGFPGGEYPISGHFRLRSFIAIVDFLGRSIGEDPEYFVEKDPRTPEVSENPNLTLELLSSEDSPDDDELAVEYDGFYYSLGPNHGYPWNREVFRLLHQLFQMSVSEVPHVGVPSITIAK